MLSGVAVEGDIKMKGLPHIRVYILKPKLLAR